MTGLSRTSSVSSKNGKQVFGANTQRQNGGNRSGAIPTVNEKRGAAMSSMPPRALSRSNSDRQKKGKLYV